MPSVENLVRLLETYDNACVAPLMSSQTSKPATRYGLKADTAFEMLPVAE